MSMAPRPASPRRWYTSVLKKSKVTACIPLITSLDSLVGPELLRHWPRAHYPKGRRRLASRYISSGCVEPPGGERAVQRHGPDAQAGHFALEPVQHSGTHSPEPGFRGHVEHPDFASVLDEAEATHSALLNRHDARFRFGIDQCSEHRGCLVLEPGRQSRLIVGMIAHT